MLYTVYAGTLTGPEARTTDDPALALDWARKAGPFAFVTTEADGQRLKSGNIVWTPEADRRCVGMLHDAVISRAILQATQ